MDSYQITVTFVCEAESMEKALDKANLEIKPENAEKISVSVEKLEAE
jgi:hypothetical protein